MAEKPISLVELRQRFEEGQATRNNLQNRMSSLKGMERKGGKQAHEAARARLRLAL